MKTTPEEICCLEKEIETARELLEVTRAAGQVTAAAALLKVIAVLSKEIQLSKFRAGELLSRESVMKVGNEIGHIIAAVLQEKEVPKWQEIADEVMRRMMGAIEPVPQELPKLGHSR